MKLTLLLLAMLLISPSAFGRAPEPARPCPNGTVRVFTQLASDGHPTESGCVVTSLLTGIAANGACPSNYRHTTVASPPHNDVCVSVIANYLDRRPEPDESSDAQLPPDVQSTPPQNESSPTQNSGRWAMFANMPWPDAAVQSVLGQACGFPFDDRLTPDSPTAAALEATVTRLNQGKESFGWTMPVIFASVKSNVANAWARSNLGEKHAGLICITTGIQQVIGDAPEEFAAMIAHEMGHAVDRDCYNYAQRSRLGQQSCEARADSIGFAIIIRAGYNPYPASPRDPTPPARPFPLSRLSFSQVPQDAGSTVGAY